MNGINAVNPDDFMDDLASELDVVQDVTSDALAHRVSRDGACMWVRTIGAEPHWTDDETTDRALAAPICAGCPVQRECLEWEFRTAGYATTGVWGPLAEEDRRTLYLTWLERRDGDQQ